ADSRAVSLRAWRYPRRSGVRSFDPCRAHPREHSGPGVEHAMITPAPVSVLPYGPGAVLACVADIAPAALAHELRRLPGVVDAVPGASTVLLTFDRPDFSE